MRIPVTMCHGTSWQPFKVKRQKNLLTADRFERYFGIAAEMGFQSISYEDLAKWRNGTADLPQRPVMFDFDHPDCSIGKLVWPIMQRFDFRGNLFVNTSPMEKIENPYHMKWNQLKALVDDGWHIGAHTYRHYRMDYLAKKDPSGRLIGQELQTCDEMLSAHLGIIPKDFAFTGTTWSQLAEDEVKKRYCFGRLWIIGTHYDTEGGASPLRGSRGCSRRRRARRWPAHSGAIQYSRDLSLQTAVHRTGIPDLRVRCVSKLSEGSARGLISTDANKALLRTRTCRTSELIGRA